MCDMRDGMSHIEGQQRREGMRDRQTDVIVVGGGLAGLAAAAYVGRTGRSVVLLEKAPAPGGRARTEHRSGYCFNLGAHALYTGGAASRVLAELGVSCTAGRPGQIGLLAGGRLQTMPATVKALLTSQALGLRDKIELATLLGSTMRTRPAALGQTSAQAWIEQHTHRPAVRQLMEATARTQLYTAALDLASADVLVSKLQLVSRYPIHYIDGGWQTLVDGLRARAVAAGVRVLSGCAVEALTDGGVRLRDGQPLRGRSVILAVSQAEAQALLATAEPSLQLPEQTPVQLACLDVGLRQLPNPSAPIVQHLERPMFLTTQSRYAQVAPAGAALVHAFKQLDPRHAGDPKADAQELEQFLDTVQP